MSDFSNELTQRLAEVAGQGLYRCLRPLQTAQSSRIQINGKTLLNFSSNDYLGLANDRLLKEAAIEAIERYGSGSGASRLISGSLPPHQELEQTIGAFHGTEAALSFSSGYAAALGALTALAGQRDLIIVDKLAHASMVDAARLSGAKLRVFAHNDLTSLADILKWSSGPSGRRYGRKVVVTESVFSMDGDLAPLREIVELKDRFGAWLMLDEAHATGLYGPNQRGLAEEQGVADRIEVHLGTLGKAVGASGGYICGSRALIDYLVNRARPFIFSTAPAPAAAAAATAGLRFIQSPAGEERRGQLWQRVAELQAAFSTPGNGVPQPAGAIIPIILGQESRAVNAAQMLLEDGLFVPAIRYPSVRRGSARLRVTLSAIHTSAEVSRLAAALGRLRFEAEASRASLPGHALTGPA